MDDSTIELKSNMFDLVHLVDITKIAALTGVLPAFWANEKFSSPEHAKERCAYLLRRKEMIDNLYKAHLEEWGPHWQNALTVEPAVKVPVACKIQHFETKTITEYVMIRVEESDCHWRTADDNSELSYDWDVLMWQHP